MAPTIGITVLAGWIGVGVGLLTRGVNGRRAELVPLPAALASSRTMVAPLLDRAVALAGVTVNDVDAYVHPAGR
jgi:hypothetical protein